MSAIIFSNLSISRTHTREPEAEVVYASRYPQLGLTAYGSSEEGADDILKKLLDVFINCLLEKGLLVQRLERTNVRWSRRGSEWSPAIADSMNVEVGVT